MLPLPPLRVVFLIEGGRSRADHAALLAVATAAADSGAAVAVVRHGLGRLSARSARLAIRAHAPDLIVTTGAASTRDTARLASGLGCRQVCYYWPSGAVDDFHRRRRSGRPARQRPTVLCPEAAVVGSLLHRQALLRYLLPADGQALLLADRLHVLPPLLDATLLESGALLTAPGGLPATLGVYGLHGAALPLLPGCGYVNLDAGLPSLAPLAGCLGVLLLAGDALDEREAAPRCALALALGKWVLASGFGDDGCAAPLELPGLDARALQTVAPKELAARLPVWLAELRLAPPAAAAGPLRSLLATALAPEAQLAGHVALLSQLAEPRRAVAAGHGAAKPPGQLGRLLRQLGRLLRRSERRVDGRK